MRGWHGLCCLHGLINWYHIVENSMDINQEDEYKCYTKACEMFHLAVLLSLYQVHIVVASYDYFSNDDWDIFNLLCSKLCYFYLASQCRHFSDLFFFHSIASCFITYVSS